MWHYLSMRDIMTRQERRPTRFSLKDSDQNKTRTKKRFSQKDSDQGTMKNESGGKYVLYWIFKSLKEDSCGNRQCKFLKHERLYPISLKRGYHRAAEFHCPQERGGSRKPLAVPGQGEAGADGQTPDTPPGPALYNPPRPPTRVMAL